jgi:MoxR-like ATPase
MSTRLEELLNQRGITTEAMEAIISKVVMESVNVPKMVRTNPTPANPTGTTTLTHKAYDRACFWLSNGYSVYLNGPSGSGKTFAAMQLADSFSQELTIISCHGEMTVYDLIGFTDGHGNYKPTEFYKAWSDGNMILMDEVDKAPGEVNVLLNAALAQGTITFPSAGTIKKQPSTMLLFTGNTKMSGADAIYSAGQRQDGSFSNRMISISWPFDDVLESMLAKSAAEQAGGSAQIGEEVFQKIKAIRKQIEEYGMNYVVGQRQSMAAADAIAKGQDRETVYDEVIFSWMDENDARRLKEATQ